MAWTAHSIGLYPGGDRSLALGCSADGSVVVGGANDTPSGLLKPFRWTSGGGMVLLPLLPSGTFSIARAVSADGSVVVGQGDTTGGTHAWRWTSGGGMVDLGIIGTGTYSDATGVSPDGSVVVGTAVPNPGSTPTHLFTWTAGGGMVDRGLQPGNTGTLGAGITNASVAAVAGAVGGDESARWESGTGFTGLGFLPGSTWMQAAAINSDGTVIVGASESPDVQAFKWVSGVLTALAYLPGGTESRARAVTPDGNVVAGYSNGPGDTQATVWVGASAPEGLPFFDAVAKEYGEGISSDGSIVVGRSTQQATPPYLPVAVYWSTDTPPPPPAIPPTAVRPLGGYRGQIGINFYGKTLFGDKFSGVVGEASFDTFEEYGFAMTAEVASPPIHDDRARVFLDRFELDVQAGVGATSGQGSDPVWMLSWSKDGGMTWSTLQKWRSMGRRGDYRKRLRWLHLGQSRQWVLRLTSTDPVRRTIIGTYATLRKGMA